MKYVTFFILMLESLRLLGFLIDNIQIFINSFFVFSSDRVQPEFSTILGIRVLDLWESAEPLLKYM